jgi:hypothetical protein
MLLIKVDQSIEYDNSIFLLYREYCQERYLLFISLFHLFAAVACFLNLHCLLFYSLSHRLVLFSVSLGHKLDFRVANWLIQIAQTEYFAIFHHEYTAGFLLFLCKNTHFFVLN